MEKIRATKMKVRDTKDSLNELYCKIYNDF